MPRYKIEVPVFVYLNIEIEGDDEEDAGYKVKDDLIFVTAMGSIATNAGRLSKCMEPFDWGNVKFEEVK